MAEVGDTRKIKRGGRYRTYVYAFNRETFKFSYIKRSTAIDNKWVTSPITMKGYQKELYTRRARALRQNIIDTISTRMNSDDYDKEELMKEVKDKLYGMSDAKIHDFAEENKNLVREYFKYVERVKNPTTGNTDIIVNREVGSEDMDASIQVLLEELDINMDDYLIKKFNKSSTERSYNRRMSNYKQEFRRKVNLNNEMSDENVKPARSDKYEEYIKARKEMSKRRNRS